MKILIIGASAAGLSAAETILKNESGNEVVIISAENSFPYYRPVLSKYITDKTIITKSRFFLKEESWYAQNLELLKNTRAVEILPKKQMVEIQDNRKIPYDRLIIASGSLPFIPLPGAKDKRNVFALKTLSDANEIYKSLKKSKKVTIVGGGILGLEMADTINSQGKEVSVIELGNRLMPKMLDQASSEILFSSVKKAGVNLYLNDVLEELPGNKMPETIKLRSGKEIQTDMIIFAIGVRADLKLVKDFITTEKGIKVNCNMETSSKNIFACGDVISYKNLPALWMPALKTGMVAGSNAMGIKKDFEMDFYPAVFKGFSNSFFSIGDISPDNESIEKIGNGLYEKYFLREKKLLGAVLMGSITKSSMVLNYLRNPGTIVNKKDLIK